MAARNRNLFFRKRGQRSTKWFGGFPGRLISLLKREFYANPGFSKMTQFCMLHKFFRREKEGASTCRACRFQKRAQTFLKMEMDISIPLFLRWQLTSENIGMFPSLSGLKLGAIWNPLNLLETHSKLESIDVVFISLTIALTWISSNEKVGSKIMMMILLNR